MSRKNHTAATLKHIRAIDKAPINLSRNPHHTRQQHWQAKHLYTVSCKLNADEYASFLDCCNRADTTRYSALRALVVAYTEAMNK